jgi:beta-glucanase (GH16 family)
MKARPHRSRNEAGRNLWAGVTLAALLALATAIAGCRQEEPATAVPAPAITPSPAPSPISTTPSEETVAAADESAAPLHDHFELDELPAGQDDFAPIGFLTWSDGSAVSVAALSIAAGDELALPDQEGANTVLQLETAVGPSGWAGFTHAFADEGLTTWTPRDWSPYEGISLWLYGQNSGGTLFVDLLDNRNPDSRGDDAERWTVDIPDDFAGWRYLELPFSDFRRKEIGNGAPNDGLNLTAVHGYAVGVFGSAAMGPQTHYVDRVGPYGVAPIRPVEAGFAEAAYSLRETGRATVRVQLSKPATQTVTVTYGVGPSQAMEGRDYEPVGGTLTFAPGETEQAFTFAAIDDSLAEGQERLLLVLTAVEGAEFGFLRRTLVTIRDDDPRDPLALLDFETFPPLRASDGVTLTLAELLPGDERALPAQTEPNQVLSVDFAGGPVETRFDHHFVEGQDWGDRAGLSFWFYGANSGSSYAVELWENQAPQTAEVAPEEWELLWSDEFDGPAGTPPDPAIWQPEIGDGTLNGIPGWGNSELQYYTGEAENVAADGLGHLAITARAVNTATTELVCWYGPCSYTSARIISRDRLEVAYGRVEARLKLPAGQGLWPAFWMLGTDLEAVGWPQSGEIDIMENVGREPDRVHHTIHGPGYSGGNGIGRGYTLPDGGAFADDFHLFAVEWQPDEIRWFVDGVHTFTATPAALPRGSEWVYNHPFFLILNVAVGGNWPGSPDDSTTFPQTMLVDYVRVYGAGSNADRYRASFVDDFTGWQRIDLPFTAFQPVGAIAGAEAPELGDVWGYGFILPAAAGSFLLDQMRFLN